MAEIKAIETQYKGYRFRSRLEARWAVFFDSVGIRYEYEPEGFDLGDGIYYLPDFYLPDDDVWIEVKGKQLNEEEREKLIRFCKAKCDLSNGGSRFRLLEGQIPNLIESTDGLIGIPFFTCESVDVLMRIENKHYSECCDDWVFIFGIWIPIAPTETVINALLKAKQARFEHGEKPII